MEGTPLAILTEDMKRMVIAQRLGYVATVCPDGTPNLSPKDTTTVWDDDHLIFADIHSAQTVENLRDNPTVEINVVDPLKRKGYRFTGKAQLLTDGELFHFLVDFYQKFGVVNAAKRINTIVMVAVERALPLASPGYEADTSEADMQGKWEKYYRKIHENSNQ